MSKRARDNSSTIAFSLLSLPFLVASLHVFQWNRENTHEVEVLGDNIVAVPRLSDGITTLRVLQGKKEGAIIVSPNTRYKSDLDIPVPRNYMRKSNGYITNFADIGDFDNDGFEDDIAFGSAIFSWRARGYIRRVIHYDVLD